jgi:biotin synthase
MLCSSKIKIGISCGSLEVLKSGKTREDSPKTLYLLTLGKCENNCSFCSQARESKTNNLYLSRIIWPPIEENKLFNLLMENGKFFKRICIQVTKSYLWKEFTKELIIKLKNFNMPISLSAPIENLNEIDEFLNLGVENINISLDVASPRLFEKLKEKSFNERTNLLILAGRKYKKRITSHIIIGLGEEENEALEIIDKLIEENINIALFAFTPIPGTRLENLPPPDYLKYRKIQIISYLLKRKLIKFSDLRFKNGELIIEEWWLNLAKPYFNEIFLTSGCHNCNRPYYNESPKITPYNFPRPIRREELKEIWRILTLNMNY